MGEQSVDLRSSLGSLRRHRRALVGAAALGAAAGVCSVVLWPPMYTSSSLVLLPPPATDSSGQTVTRDPATEVSIASSDAVLGPAASRLTPPMTVRNLAKQVDVSATTTDVLDIWGSATTRERARQITNAVAGSEVGYVTMAASSLTNAQQAAIADRQRNLRASLATVNEEIKKTNARRSSEDPTSPEGRADASAVAQLTAQQANLVLQIDALKDKAAIIQPTSGASLIQPATPARRPWLALRYGVFALLGMALALVMAASVLVLRNRRDRRLRFRDEMADAVGSTVFASVRSRVPRDTAGWASLLETYTPGTVDAWALRQALRQAVFGDIPIGARRSGKGDGAPRERASMTVLTLSEDLRGLALAAQMASYAASTGVRTRLVAAQGHDSAAALWAACASLSDAQEARPGLVVGTGAADEDDEEPAELTVVVAVLDRRRPELLRELPQTSVTILAVSSGTATAEDLARAAVTADDAGRHIAGIVVADPDDLDRTTGRLLLAERSQQVPLPTRLTGVHKPSASGVNVSGIRRRPS
jgi:capsular polysaccharide biosynthesis protein